METLALAVKMQEVLDAQLFRARQALGCEMRNPGLIMSNLTPLYSTSATEEDHRYWRDFSDRARASARALCGQADSLRLRVETTQQENSAVRAQARQLHPK